MGKRLWFAAGASGGDIFAKMNGVAMHWDVEVDCTGLLCPLPVLKAQKRLRGMASGQVLALVATDAMAAVDVPHFCTQAGHALLSAVPEGDATRFLIRAKE